MAVSSLKAEAMIDKLPAELTIDVMSYLRPHDLTQLARASKRYRGFAQSALWTSVGDSALYLKHIELHRQDAHDNCFTLSHKQPPRAYLEDYLLHPWCYRDYDGVDAEYDTRNEQFRAAIREMYASNGKSEAWDRIKPVVRHLCLTVTHESPPDIWNTILSLPNLRTIEVIGEYSEDRRSHGHLDTFLMIPTGLYIHLNPKIGEGRPQLNWASGIRRQPVYRMASASTIVSLDLGLLDEPEFFRGHELELSEYGETICPVYIGPRGGLWHDAAWPEFASLTHLLLCKPVWFNGFRKRPNDLDYEAPQMKQWASLLRSIRLTAVEIVLEHRKIFVDRHDEVDEHIKADADVKCPPDIRFRHRVVEQAFTEPWPNLKTLTFRGMSSAKGDYWPKAGPDESLQDYSRKLLPGVQVNQIPGNYMFFNTERGTILNQHGADGLKVHLEFDGKHDLEALYDSDNFTDEDDWEWRRTSLDYLHHLSTRE
ncbi:uncharacterized protein J4E78_008998 [Alternaria triticimaculans]|uniref:uncharacterized protein n=1 Tax=Alternaria triticimaculans TaxID=297637 RepID=UPI0020C3D81B|nr:uncharacterized protein J4E78_008998 [Alternaria triticimaculans]KAI4647026.1 hypothetical protein J4E78_008998 [Alternaria triticimaculans]